MKPDDKLSLLKNINRSIDTIIEKKKKILEKDDVSKKDWEVKESFIYENEDVDFKLIKLNWDTKLSFNQKSNFKRIVCIGGEIEIHIPQYDEIKKLSPINTFLIPPDLEYNITSKVESEFIVFFKPKEGKNEQLT